MKRKLIFLLSLLLLGSLVLGYRPVRAQSGQNRVVLLRLEGALNPVMLEHLKRAQQIAEQEQAQAIILELDTPGGSLDLMEQIEQQIRASQTPIVVFVYPRGAMAASAGTIITLSGHLAAMAPETTIGAASPVGSQGEDLGQTEQAKTEEAMKATVRALAAHRSQKAIDLGQEMIQNARAVSVDEALAAGLVDFKAAGLDDLLSQVDGHNVLVLDKTVTLHTSGARVIDVPRSIMEDLLTVLANPNLVFLLMAVGVQALLIEFSHPGGWVAGFIGAVCLLLAGYGLGFLPVNWFGLLFMALAFLLFVLDIKAPTHGALTAAGAGAFIVGALVLFNSPNITSVQRVSIPLVVGTGLALGLIFFTLVMFALRAQHEPLRMGRPMLVGLTGVATTAVDPIGTVQVGSELWTAVLAEGEAPLPKGAHVEVTAVDNLQVEVRPAREEAVLEQNG